MKKHKNSWASKEYYKRSSSSSEIKNAESCHITPAKGDGDVAIRGKHNLYFTLLWFNELVTGRIPNAVRHNQYPSMGFFYKIYFILFYFFFWVLIYSLFFLTGFITTIIASHNHNQC